MRVVSSVEIRRPIAEVFGFVSEPEHLPEWASGVASAGRISGSLMGLGARFKEVVSSGWHRATVWEITEYEPPRAVAYRALDGAFPAAARYVLDQVGGATRLTVEAEVELRAFFAPSPALERSIGWQLETDLGTLRRLLEGGREAPGAYPQRGR